MPDAQTDASHNDLAAKLRRNWIPAMLAIILIAGAYFRFTGVNWDQDQHQQPDERFMTMVAGQIVVETSSDGQGWSALATMSLETTAELIFYLSVVTEEFISEPGSLHIDNVNSGSSLCE